MIGSNDVTYDYMRRLAEKQPYNIIQISEAEIRQVQGAEQDVIIQCASEKRQNSPVEPRYTQVEIQEAGSFLQDRTRRAIYHNWLDFDQGGLRRCRVLCTTVFTCRSGWTTVCKHCLIVLIPLLFLATGLAVLFEIDGLSNGKLGLYYTFSLIGGALSSGGLQAITSVLMSKKFVTTGCDWREVGLFLGIGAAAGGFVACVSTSVTHAIVGLRATGKIKATLGNSIAVSIPCEIIGCFANGLICIFAERKVMEELEVPQLCKLFSYFCQNALLGASLGVVFGSLTSHNNEAGLEVFGATSLILLLKSTFRIVFGRSVQAPS